MSLKVSEIVAQIVAQIVAPFTQILNVVIFFLLERMRTRNRSKHHKFVFR